MASARNNNRKPRLLRITTVPVSLQVLLRGQLNFMQENGFDVLAVSAPGKEVAAIEAEGISHVSVAFTRSVTPFKDVVCLVQLIRVIHKFRPDIVHTHTPKAGLLGMLASWICRVPIRIHTVAGMPLMEATGITRVLLWCSEHLTYFFAQKIYPNSRELHRYMNQKFSMHRTKFKVLGNGSSNGINTNYFKKSQVLENAADQFRARYGLSKNNLVYCFVGRIVTSKGIGELIQAFEKLAGQVPHARLMLVGTLESEREGLNEKQMQEMKANEKIILTGFLNDVRVPLAVADVFVFPSYREGFPNGVLQAACMELPCIVTDINGCNEIVRDQESGLFVQVRDVNGLADAMLTLASDEPFRLRLSTQARAFVTGRWDQNEVWANLLAEYHKLLEHV